MKTKIKLIIKFGVLLIAAGGAFYWLRLAPVKVQAYKVVTGTVVNEVMGTGTLEPRVRAAISPKISGLLVEVLTDQNKRIVKGQLLARLDDGDWRQQVEIAKADLAAAQAAVERIGAEIESVQATAIRTQANLERVSILRKSQAVAQNELERAVESNNVAEANLRGAKLAKIEAERTVEKSAASLQFYQERLKDSNICAPFDGLVVRRNRDPGAVVVPGASILDVISTDQLWVSAWVDETVMGLLAKGQPARIVFRSNLDAVIPGKVARLGAETDRETREFLVDVDVLKLPPKWVIGQRVEVYIETSRRNNTPFVPQRLVIWRDGQAGVLIDDKGRTKWQKITLGLRGKENVEVTEGLLPGQIIIGVLPGNELPRDGRAIRYDKL
ncbi:MAG: efflux RND transporter periplasmic adaptor subunit [Victivallaceae bacterium]